MTNNYTNTVRILAKDRTISNDTWVTGLANNDLIIGNSGSGKTSGYVIPNINQHFGSYVVADTKGNLANKLAPSLKDDGYDIYTLDFVNLSKSIKYNPLEYIRRYDDGSYNEQDVHSIAAILLPMNSNIKDPYWEYAARTVIECCIAYVLESLAPEEQNLVNVSKVLNELGTEHAKKMFAALEHNNPSSLAVKKFKRLTKNEKAEKMFASTQGIAAEAFSFFDMNCAEQVFAGETLFKISDLGNKKTVLFVNISDTDRSSDTAANLFYCQALQVLCRCADEQPDSRLKVPVRFILDDFGCNTKMPNFDKVISVIRSREISVSIILQSITQLKSMYSPAEASTIINNCDHILYLGSGSDIETAEFIGVRTNQPPNTVLNMPNSKAYLFERGKKAELVDKITYDFCAKILEKTGFDSQDAFPPCESEDLTC